jgi:hypothetical protein
MVIRITDYVVVKKNIGISLKMFIRDEGKRIKM